jgi:hypothetical protein
MSNHTPIRSVRRASWLAVAAGLALAGTASAERMNVTVEQGIETGTRAVSLPSKPSGTLAARPCGDCDALQLRFDGRTAFYIGKQAVPYAKFREAASKGNLRLDVVYTNSTRVLTRLRIPAVAVTK